FQIYGDRPTKRLPVRRPAAKVALLLTNPGDYELQPGSGHVWNFWTRRSRQSSVVALIFSSNTNTEVGLVLLPAFPSSLPGHHAASRSSRCGIGCRPCAVDTGG